MFKKNNRSAMKNAEFVDQTVNELIVSGCAIKVPFQPYIVNPFSVVLRQYSFRNRHQDTKQC
jgi:hypothetical protein